MKKRSLLLLCALLLMPMSTKAEDLPDVLSAAAQGLSEGLLSGAKAVNASSQELTLTLSAEDVRIEEGQSLLLTLHAGNPYPTPADVTLTLEMPERLSCAQPLSFTTRLEPAQIDPETGEFVPSSAEFTREVTLLPGGDSEDTQVRAELSMGTRFYRAALPLKLCVPNITACASIEGVQDHLLQAGDAFSYLIEAANDGEAPKDVPVALHLPDGVSPDGALPAGFSLHSGVITGTLRAEAMGGSDVRLSMRADSDVLEGDDDACRLLRGSLTIDGETVALPMLKAVAPMISASLTPQQTTLEEGEVSDLIITVANTGLAPADVEIACQLPQGLTVLRDLTKAPAQQERKSAAAQDEEANDAEIEKTPAAPADVGKLPPADGAAQPAMKTVSSEPEIREENGLLLISMHMDAAQETGEDTAAATKEIALRVRADMPIESVKEQLLGASLAWKINGGETTLGEAVALQIAASGMMGLSHSEWNGILLAALLMLITVCCLYSAVKSDKCEDDYCFE